CRQRSMLRCWPAAASASQSASRPASQASRSSNARRASPAIRGRQRRAGGRNGSPISCETGAARTAASENRASAPAEIGHSFYLDQYFRLRKGPHFYQGGSRKISGEEFAARAPNLSVFLD